MQRSIKVSGFVPIEQHIEMGRIARENQSTIGAIVSLALKRIVQELKKRPQLAKELERDPRSTRRKNVLSNAD